MQSLAGVGDVASVIEFRVADVDRAEETAARIAAAAGEGFVATTWADENRALFRALRLEKLVTALFIGLITFVAGLNILVVLAMTVTDRAKDIAVLMAMGARREQIRAVFLVLGLVVGGIGTTAGLVAGYGIAWTAGAYQLIPLDPQIYSVPFVPFDPNILDSLWIVGGGAADQRGVHSDTGALGGAYRAGGDFALRMSALVGVAIIRRGSQIWSNKCTLLFARAARS